MTDDICGHETNDGTPCEHPAGENGRCHIPQHNPDGGGTDAGGRPSSFDEQTKEAIYAAVGSGLKVTHVAAAAGVSPDTLRRWSCCLTDLRTAELDTPDPCEFCEGYASAHANGAREVLEEASAEFRASASFGYAKTERTEVENTGDDPLAELTLDWDDAQT